MLEIWGRANSLNVQKVLWCCRELGLQYRRIDAGGAYGRTDEADYRRLNPTGLVPTLVDDDFALWESNAIVRYLARGRGGDQTQLVPQDPFAQARAEQWMDWQTTALWPSLRQVFMALVRGDPAARDTALIDAGVRRTAHCLQALETHLASRDYIDGSFGMGDIPLGVTVNRWFQLDIERPSMPYVRAWYERLLSRAPYRQVVADIALT